MTVRCIPRHTREAGGFCISVAKGREVHMKALDPRIHTASKLYEDRAPRGLKTVSVIQLIPCSCVYAQPGDVSQPQTSDQSA